MQVFFETKCGNDKKCVAQLNLKTDILLNSQISQDNQIIEGLHKSLILDVNMENIGEPSYLTELIIRYKPLLNLLKLNSKCKNRKDINSNSGIVQCNVGNPFENEIQDLYISFDLNQLDFDLTEVQFNLEMKSASEIHENSKSYENITLSIIRNASIKILG